jgi:hypothetical protein
MEGKVEEISFTYLLFVYLFMDIRTLVHCVANLAVCGILFLVARQDGYWIVLSPFIPLTVWMFLKARTQRLATPKVKTQ